MFRFLPLAALIAPVAALAQTTPAGPVLYAPCKVCHTIEKGGRNGVGPNLHGIVGRKAASVPGYTYSAAMKSSGKVWTPAALDAYLLAPSKAVPGTKMIYVGMKDPARRKALIAWMATQR